MVVIEGAVLDYNGTVIMGHDEITAAYACVWNAMWHGYVTRALKLLGPLQYKCWDLTLKGELDRVGDVFSDGVLMGEDAGYIERHAREFDIGSSWWRWLLHLPKIGKKMDTTPIPGAIEFAHAAKKAGKRTGIYSAAFTPFIEGNLRRHGYLDLFDAIEANGWIEDETGHIDVIQTRVYSRNKGCGFRNFLEQLKLRRDGEGVAYAGDTAPDMDVFRFVEYPIVAPTAKDKFREQCRFDSDFGKRVLVPKDWSEMVNFFWLE